MKFFVPDMDIMEDIQDILDMAATAVMEAAMVDTEAAMVDTEAVMVDTEVAMVVMADMGITEDLEITEGDMVLAATGATVLGTTTIT